MHYTFHTPLLRTIHLILYDNPILYILCIAPSIYLYTTRNASHNPIFYIVCTTHPTHPSIHTQAQTLKHTHSSTHTRAHTHSSIHKRCSPQMCIDPAQVFCASLPPWSRRPRGDRPREQGVWCVCACMSVCTWGGGMYAGMYVCMVMHLWLWLCMYGYVCMYVRMHLCIC